MTVEKELCSLLDELSDNIYTHVEATTAINDVILDELINLSDRSSDVYEDMVAYLIEYLNTNDSRLSEVYELMGIYYIKPAVPLSVENVHELGKFTTIFNLWERDCIKYAEHYEEFCSLFLQDYGLILLERTKRNRDYGIDILCTSRQHENDYLGIYSIDVLCQVKFYTTPVDQPVVRAIIGDSLLISFEPEIYPHITHSPKKLMVISHKGFTKGAELLAKKSGISVVDTQWMIKWIASKTNFNEMKCVKYLRNCFETNV
ncbi:restriction endonuclease [Sporosarcina sp. G11-34]|uniref:restriction endonuclease n=1 Tax=Sporosarcina sp. G11-34 TaxID=2849605 RepID=UPI0022A947CD|nr:restriction endonuclease [Sporosarcina sp. G11-34]